MGLTYFGHPVACRAALTNIDIMEREGLLKNSRDVGEVFQNAGRELLQFDHVGDVRGHGLMLAVDLVEDKTTKSPFPGSAAVSDRVFKSCLKRGLVVRPVGDRIVLSPPLIISEAEASKVFEILGQAVSEISA